MRKKEKSHQRKLMTQCQDGIFIALDYTTLAANSRICFAKSSTWCNPDKQGRNKMNKKERGVVQ